MTPKLVAAGRITWTLITLVVVQTVVCGVSLLPVVIAWQWLADVVPPNRAARVILLSFTIVPFYAAFAISLMMVSPLAIRLVGWHTPADARLRIADMDWPFLQWVRYGASMHIVRVIAGTMFRGTPLWTTHMRLGGARLGRRVYVNSLSVSDYDLLQFGDGVVIGGSVHLSGHTVEAGILKTARVRLGRNVTIGLGSIVEIGVEIGDNAQVGALSFVPKYSRLKEGVIYAGVPAVPIEIVTPTNRQRADARGGTG